MTSFEPYIQCFLCVFVVVVVCFFEGWVGRETYCRSIRHDPHQCIDTLSNIVLGIPFLVLRSFFLDI